MSVIAGLVGLLVAIGIAVRFLALWLIIIVFAILMELASCCPVVLVVIVPLGGYFIYTKYFQKRFKNAKTNNISK